MTAVAKLRDVLAKDERLAKVFQGGATNLASRGVTLLVSAVTLPLTLHYLGAVEYGIWVTISTSVAMLSLLDLGIASTLTNHISQAFAESNDAKAQAYVSTAFWLTTAVVAVCAPLLFLLWRFLDWQYLFHLTSPVAAHRASLCVAIACGFFLCSLPLTLANRVLAGYQEVHRANYFGIVNSVLGLLAIVGTVLLRGSLVTLMLAYSLAMLVGTVGLNAWLYVWARPWLRPRVRLVRRRHVRSLFGQGSLFFVLQITGLVVFNSDNLVVGHFLGQAAVTPYSTAWRLTQYAALLQGLIVPSLWPAFTEAYLKRHMGWINTTYRSLRRRTLMAVGCAAVLLGLGGRTVIRLWAGPAAVPEASTLWLMAVFAFVMSVTTNQALLLTATGRLRVEAAAAALAALANLVLSVFLVQRIGAQGVILSTLLSFVVFMVGPQAWEVGQVLRGRYLPPLPSSEKVPA